MKLACVCGQEYIYDHRTSGQPFVCKWCNQTVMMPAFQSLDAGQQAEYRSELKEQQQKEEKEKQRAAAKEVARVEKEKKRIEANQRKAQIQAAKRASTMSAASSSSEATSLFAKVIWLLDLRFRRYLTPWIIRFTWLWAILLIVAGWSFYSAVGLWRVMPRTQTVELTIPTNIERQKRTLSFTIAMKEPQEQRRRPAQPPNDTEPDRDDAPQQTPSTTPDEEDLLAKYGSMTVAQLRAELAKLTKQYPESEETTGLEQDGDGSICHIARGNRFDLMSLPAVASGHMRSRDCGFQHCRHPCRHQGESRRNW